MPFDAVDRTKAVTTLADACAQLGITPIPLADLEAYKAEALKKARAKLAPYRRHNVIWEEYPLQGYLHYAQFNPEGMPPIPAAVLAIADRITGEMPRKKDKPVERVVGWVYTDPYFLLRRRGEEICVGIWDAHKVVRLAECSEASKAAESVAKRLKKAVWGK